MPSFPVWVNICRVGGLNIGPSIDNNGRYARGRYKQLRKSIIRKRKNGYKNVPWIMAHILFVGSQ